MMEENVYQRLQLRIQRIKSSDFALTEVEMVCRLSALSCIFEEEAFNLFRFNTTFLVFKRVICLPLCINIRAPQALAAKDMNSAERGGLSLRSLTTL